MDTPKGNYIRIRNLMYQVGYTPADVTRLREMGFFIKPGSLNYHHNFEGGLAEHSLGVFDILEELNDRLELGFKFTDMVEAALFHDLCKCDDYLVTTEFKIKDYVRFDKNPGRGKGHGTKSVELADAILDIQFNDVVKEAIENHMGGYVNDLTNLNRAYKRGNALAYWLHVADMLSANPQLKGGTF